MHLFMVRKLSSMNYHDTHSHVSATAGLWSDWTWNLRDSIIPEYYEGAIHQVQKCLQKSYMLYIGSSYICTKYPNHQVYYKSSRGTSQISCSVKCRRLISPPKPVIRVHLECSRFPLLELPKSPILHSTTCSIRRTSPGPKVEQ